MNSKWGISLMQSAALPRAPAYGVITLIRSGVETDYDLHLSPDSGDFVHIAFEEKNHLTVYQGDDEKRGRAIGTLTITDLGDVVIRVAENGVPVWIADCLIVDSHVLRSGQKMSFNTRSDSHVVFFKTFDTIQQWSCDIATNQYKKRKAQADHDNSLTCSVCMEDFFSPHSLDVCGHVFCQSCISVWLSENSSSCPLCRRVPLADSTVCEAITPHRAFDMSVKAKWNNTDEHDDRAVERKVVERSRAMVASGKYHLPLASAEPRRGGRVTSAFLSRERRRRCVSHSPGSTLSWTLTRSKENLVCDFCQQTVLKGTAVLQRVSESPETRKLKTSYHLTQKCMREFARDSVACISDETTSECAEQMVKNAKKKYAS